jgi:hypothetical protein
MSDRCSSTVAAPKNKSLSKAEELIGYVAILIEKGAPTSFPRWAGCAGC